MTSVDSGVETGNDSNDSSIVHHDNLTSCQIGNINSVVAATTSSQEQKNEIETCISRFENSSMLGPLTLLPPTESFYEMFNSHAYPDEDSSTATSSTGSREVREFKCPLMFTVNALPTSGGLLDKPSTTFKIRESPRKSVFKIRGLTRESGKMSESWKSIKDYNRGTSSKVQSTLTKIQASLNERRMRFAAATNNIMAVKVLLHKGVSPNNYDELGRTPLHLACYRGYLEMVNLLLTHGAYPHQHDTTGLTPLDMPTMMSKKSLFPRLVYTGSDVIYFNDSSSNPLQIAESKLRTLQNYKDDDMLRAKEEVQNVVHMLLTYLKEQRTGSNTVEFLSTLCSRLSLSNTSDQVQDDVKDLLANLEALTITS